MHNMILRTQTLKESVKEPLELRLSYLSLAELAQDV